MQVAVLAGSLSSSGCRSREELPYVRGQRQQWRVPGCDDVGAAERNHPASEVRGNDLEEPPRIQGQGRGPGGATPSPSPGTATRRSHPAPEARGGGWEDQPTSKEWWLR